ncbi:hypothetical protein ABGB18_05695 [Nonomuraea sp. B12E4]|uniref:hypothetical protein n=1 Tax=Nonomuraea sp. B12E4 TaxID=3153564 RepID=UPI00325F75DB
MSDHLRVGPHMTGVLPRRGRGPLCRGLLLHADHEPQSPTALRSFTLDGTDHASHKQQGSMIRRYISCRNRHAADERLREIVNRANVA